MSRVRVSIRELLLIVGLFAVFFAWIGARWELRRIRLRGEIRQLEIFRNYASGRLDDPVDGKGYRALLQETDELIVAKQEQLGISD